MKFTPGQKVLVLGEHRNSMVPEMQKFIGKVVTISSIKGNSLWPYRVVECDGWVWAEYMFADALNPNNPNVLFLRR